MVETATQAWFTLGSSERGTGDQRVSAGQNVSGLGHELDLDLVTLGLQEAAGCLGLNVPSRMGLN